MFISLSMSLVKTYGILIANNWSTRKKPESWGGEKIRIDLGGDIELMGFGFREKRWFCTPRIGGKNPSETQQ